MSNEPIVLSEKGLHVLELLPNDGRFHRCDVHPNSLAALARKGLLEYELTEAGPEAKLLPDGEAAKSNYVLIGTSEYQQFLKDRKDKAESEDYVRPIPSDEELRAALEPMEATQTRLHNGLFRPFRGPYPVKKAETDDAVPLPEPRAPVVMPGAEEQSAPVMREAEAERMVEERLSVISERYSNGTIVQRHSVNGGNCSADCAECDDKRVLELLRVMYPEIDEAAAILLQAAEAKRLLEKLAGEE